MFEIHHNYQDHQIQCWDVIYTARSHHLHRQAAFVFKRITPSIKRFWLPITDPSPVTLTGGFHWAARSTICAAEEASRGLVHLRKDDHTSVTFLHCMFSFT